MTITKRDAEGKIMPGGKVLSSEEARAMGRKGGLKRSFTVEDMEGDIEALVTEAGYDMATAPKALLLTAKNAVTGNNQAIIEYSRRWLFRSTDSAPESVVDNEDYVNIWSLPIDIQFQIRMFRSGSANERERYQMWMVKEVPREKDQAAAFRKRWDELNAQIDQERAKEGGEVSPPSESEPDPESLEA